MSTDFTQALEVVGLISVACTIISPILIWLLSYQPETI
ncbi:hypothetical protein CY0110_08556 [Crocosphaera chwakensis CCY0110]|uniref:Uncharacterized protein n=1 Tax=Crocosphaera chwakensis CCY0110 TaxID=391612 RepID=A3IVD5_9CHRO|nr:hypothetical protein CY0110_08556 [Crocosphaera chwakensis CCY0110]